MKKSIQKAKDKVDKIRRHPKAPTVAAALGVTGSVVNAMGSWVPGVGMVGGALKMGASMLDPDPKLSDLHREADEIKTQLESSIGRSHRALKEALNNVQEEIQSTYSSAIRAELQSSFESMAGDLNNIEVELTETKDLLLQTYLLTLDMRYKKGMERVESTYQSFLEGAHNLEGTLEEFSNFMTELQVEANDSFRPENVKSYLRALSEAKGAEVAKNIPAYIMIVRAKYLQMTTAFYIYKNDTIRVEKEFTWFNEFFERLRDIHVSIFNEELAPPKETFDPRKLNMESAKSHTADNSGPPPDVVPSMPKSEPAANGSAKYKRG